MTGRSPTVLGTIGRVLLVPVAFVLGAIAAGFVLITLGLERVTQALNGTGETDEISVVFAVLEQGALLASAVSIIPAILVVIVGEVARIRSLLYYMVGGGIAIAFAPLIVQLASFTGADWPHTAVLQVSATAGFFGGFIYWLVAGRTA